MSGAGVKDASTEAWLPTIPHRWKVGSLRHFASFGTGWTPPTGDDAAYAGDHPWANISDLGSKWLDATAKHLSDEAVAGIKPVGVGDLMFAFKLSVGAVSRAAVPMHTNEAIASFAPSDDLNLDYAYYALPFFIPMNANTNIYGARLLNSALIRSAQVAIPPMDEQRLLAVYLDRETAKIDALIEEQVGLVEVLRERRMTVISRAVTRGLRAARMIPTGDPYLVEAPENWRVSRLSREMLLNGGQVDPRDDPWVDMVLVAPNHIESGTGRLIGRETAREQGADSGKYVAKQGQVLYSKIRPALNKVTIAVEDCLCSADMYAMSSRTAGDPRFAMYFMLARPFHTFATLQSLRVKMPKVNREELGAAPWVIPPVEEQHAITTYLDDETRKIDALIAEAVGIVDVAKERRSALIAAAVTGQIDVRGEVT